MANPNCAFCDHEELDWRTIRVGKYIRSIVSVPWFREGHTLVIPNRHVTQLGDVEVGSEEDREMSLEIRRLGKLLCEKYGGFGYQTIQKYLPKKAGTGVTVGHLHTHVVPMTEADELFAMPSPNTVAGFSNVPHEEVIKMAEALR